MKTIMGAFSSRHEAEHVIEDLRKLNISNSDITYVEADPSGQAQKPSTGSNMAQGMGSGAITGGVIGAVAGLVVANGVLPGVGTLFVAGPLAAALGLTGVAATTAAGTLTGAAAGGLVGALSGLGMSADEAKIYEQRIKKGSAVVGAQISDSVEPAVRSIFNAHRADEIRTYNV